MAGEYANESGLPYYEAFDLVKKNGGARKKDAATVNRSVKLTENDCRKIVKKYGSLTTAVKTLLRDV